MIMIAPPQLAFKSEYTFYVRQEMKRFDFDGDGSISAFEAARASIALRREGDTNMADLFKYLAKKLFRKDPNDDIYKDGKLSFVVRRGERASELKRLAGATGSDQVFSQRDLDAFHGVENTFPPPPPPPRQFSYDTEDVAFNLLSVNPNFFDRGFDAGTTKAQIINFLRTADLLSSDQADQLQALVDNFSKISRDGRRIFIDDIYRVAGLDGNIRNFTNTDVSIA